MSPYPSYELLSPACTSRLAYERAELPAHSAVLHVFEAAPLRVPDGGIDFEAIRGHVAACLHRVPSYQKKVVWLGNGEAVWVDDDHFDLDYHLRHTALPRPGDESQLEALCARLAEQRLDPERPLWEVWVVEGLEGGRFALLTKLHDCLLERGEGGLLSSFLLSPDAVSEPAGPLREGMPRPPSARALRNLAWQRRLSAPIRSAAGAVRSVLEIEDPVSELRQRWGSLRALVAQRLPGLPESLLNGPVGPHRSFATHLDPLSRWQPLREALHVSLDVLALSVLSGALRAYMVARQVPLEQIDFRVSAPARVRGQARSAGGHAQIQLPLDQDDPAQVVSRIQEQMADAGHAEEAGAEEVLDELTSWIRFDLQTAIARASHCVVSSLRGPSFPLFLLGARQLAVYPQPALSANHGLAVALISQDGRLCWGLSADRERIPDLRNLCRGLDVALGRLEARVGVPSDRPAPAATESLPAWDASSPLGAWPRELSAPGCPSEIREQVFAQHRALSHLLDGVEVALSRFRRGGGPEHIEVLRERGRRLHDRLVEHLAFEDRFLVPTIREIDAWGEERARAIECDHRDQREVLAFLLAQLERRDTPAPVLAEQLFGWVASVREDMEHEEHGVLGADLLRDDVVSIGAEAG